eukprot:Mycagemm_TRINITY_DN11452_c0_g1::TRINITY_DN11452_c0_g1_i1::g.2776::m.2776 type:complete len:111 gc:universal TRINITY_DN11452_c0_g1_i1:631-299(-)
MQHCWGEGRSILSRPTGLLGRQNRGLLRCRYLRGRSRTLLGANVDRDLALASHSLGLENTDFEHSVVERGRHLGGVNAVRQGHGAAEGTHAALHAVEALVLLLLARLALA